MKSLMRSIVFFIALNVAVLPALGIEKGSVLVTRDFLDELRTGKMTKAQYEMQLAVFEAYTVEFLTKVRDHIVDLTTLCETFDAALTEKILYLEMANAEISRLKKRSSGFWLGAAAGIPFPSAGAQAMYVFNNSIGLMVSGGYSTNPYVQAGVTVRVGK